MSHPWLTRSWPRNFNITQQESTRVCLCVVVRHQSRHFASIRDFYWPFGRVIVPSLKLHYITVHNGKLGWVFERCLQILLIVNRESKWTHLNRTMLIQQLTCFWDLVDMLKNELSTAWCKRKKISRQLYRFFCLPGHIPPPCRKKGRLRSGRVREICCVSILTAADNFLSILTPKGNTHLHYPKAKAPLYVGPQKLQNKIYIFLESNLARQ